MVIGMYEKNAGQSPSGTLIYPLKKKTPADRARDTVRAGNYSFSFQLFNRYLLVEQLDRSVFWWIAESAI